MYHPDCGSTTTKRHEPTDLCMRHPHSLLLLLTRPLSSYVMSTTNVRTTHNKLNIGSCLWCQCTATPKSRSNYGSERHPSFVEARERGWRRARAQQNNVSDAMTRLQAELNLKMRHSPFVWVPFVSLFVFIYWGGGGVCVCLCLWLACDGGKYLHLSLLPQQTGVRTQTRPFSNQLSQSGDGSNKNGVLSVCRQAADAFT